MEWYKYAGFGLTWAIIIYLLNSAIAREWKQVKPKVAITYFVVTAAIGLYGEIFLDSIYNQIVGHPLWYYRIAPIYGGYTSSFAIVTWGLYGFHLYLLHDTLRARWSITKTRHLSLILSVEALFLEALLTLSAKPVFGTYMYYYLPSDLWHVSSFQNIPFYFLFAVIAVKTLHRARKDTRYFTIVSIFLLCVILIMTHAQ